MLEIVILYFVYRKFSRTAKAKGRSGAWGWFGVGMWVMAEFMGIGLIDPSFYGDVTDPVALLRLSAVGFAFGLVGLIAAWLILRNLAPLMPGMSAAAAPSISGIPAPPPPDPALAVRGGIVPTHAVPEGEPAPAGSVFAGYCDECDMMVWLTPDQACPVHGRDTVGSIHRPL